MILFPKKYLWLLLCGFMLILSSRVYPQATEVTIQLRWYHQFQFAGFYAALERGYYRDEGLHVTIVEGNNTTNPVVDVLTAKADFSIGLSELVMNRINGQPIVLVAAIIQESPLSLAVRGDRGINDLRDLIGKKVMLNTQDAELMYMFSREKIPLNAFTTVPHSFRFADLLSDSVDAISCYSTNEPFYFHKHNLPYKLFRPVNYGASFYGDCLFTSEDYARKNPETVEKVKKATIRGWEYALTHKEELIEFINSKFPGRKSVEQLYYEASVITRLIQSGNGTVGEISMERWESIASSFAELGIVPKTYDLTGFVFDPEGYAPISSNMLRITVISLLVAVVAVGFIFYLVRVNRRLAQEVEQRKAAELQVRAMKERVEYILHALPTPIIIKNLEGIITDCNEAMVRFMDVTHNEIIGRTLLDIYDEDMARLLMQKEKRQIQTRAIDSMDITLRLPNNQRREVYITKAPLFSKDGEVESIISILVDLTKQKEAEAALRAGEEKFKMLAESSVDGILIADKYGRITYWNKACEEIFGLPRRRAIEMTILDIIKIYLPNRNGKSAQSFFERHESEMLIDLLRPFYNKLLEDRIVISSKEYFVQYVVFPIKTETESLICAIIREITERKRTERKLQQQNAELRETNLAKDKFFSIIAHDLKNPFHAINGIAEVLIEDYASFKDADKLKYLEKIKESGKEAYILLENLLEWSRSQTGRIAVKLELSNLYILTKDVLLQFEAALLSKNLKLSVFMERDIAAIVDENMFKTVMRNLISNAIKFTNPGGSITLASSTTSNEVAISVTDSGIGMPPEDIEKLFRIDQNYSRPGTSMEKGTGLGLLLVKEFVTKMEGVISVESKPGEGSTFRVTLPL